MTFYKVQFEHESRRSKFPRYKGIESVDVHVEAEDATDAVNQARQIFLFEHAAWTVRVVLVESPGSEQLEP